MRDKDFCSLQILGNAPLLVKHISFASKLRFHYKHKALISTLADELYNINDLHLDSVVYGSFAA
eukprot:3428222-Karenia_brevis.AAC.1